jgi:hypothetical protein
LHTQRRFELAAGEALWAAMTELCSGLSQRRWRQGGGLQGMMMMMMMTTDEDEK